MKVPQSVLFCVFFLSMLALYSASCPPGEEGTLTNNWVWTEPVWYWTGSQWIITNDGYWTNYPFRGPPCTQCHPEHYKSTTSYESCSKCPLNTLYDAFGADDIKDCYCAWVFSYEGPNGGPCTQKCQHNTYSVTSPPEWINYVEKMCNDCPTYTGHNSYQQTSINSCKCFVGLTGPDGGPCELCPAGKYKTTQGSAACTDCPAGKFSSRTQADEAAACESCGAGEGSPAGSDNYADCVSCTPGKYGAAGKAQRRSPSASSCQRDVTGIP